MSVDLKSIRTQLRDAENDLTRLETRQASAVETKADLERQIRDLDFDPDNLDAEIAQLNTDIEEAAEALRVRMGELTQEVEGHGASTPDSTA